MRSFFSILVFSIFLGGCETSNLLNEYESVNITESIQSKTLKEITHEGDKMIYGGGGTTNRAKGVALIRHASNQGYPPAMSILAGLHLNGNGVAKNPKLAQKYYTISANQGYGPSQFNLGIMLMDGKEVTRDLESAYYYLSLAARNRRDLKKLTQAAARYRDLISKELDPQKKQYADANLLLQ